MKSIAPNIFVTDINETIAFYTQLGFSITTKLIDYYFETATHY